jgi:[acyl-carrier-protein] S-malonyltransferase
MLAPIFPGQGSQHTGMGKFLVDNFKSAQNLFEEASDTLSINFKKLCFEGSDPELALTQNTQPCLLLVSTASFQVLKNEYDYSPKTSAGHSVGEYAAVVAAGAMAFTEAMRAVRLRGEFMQSAVPVGVGGMSAVMGLNAEQVMKLCKWTEEQTGETPVEPANFNAPGQIVISGKKTLLDWLSANLDTTIFAPETPRCKLIPLKVSAPFHCSMMKPAEEKMRTVLSEMDFRTPKFPVVQNVHAEPVTTSEELRQNLVKQISAPVRWIECVENMQKSGVSEFIEVGCGKTLAGLVKKISGANVFAMNSLEDLKVLETKITEDKAGT